MYAKIEVKAIGSAKRHNAVKIHESLLAGKCGHNQPRMNNCWVGNLLSSRVVSPEGVITRIECVCVGSLLVTRVLCYC